MPDSEYRYGLLLKKSRTSLLRLVPHVILIMACLLFYHDLRADLTLDAVMHHTPATPGELLHLELTVTNTDAFTRSGVTLEMEYPANLSQLFESSFSGDCPSTSCTPGETVTWTLGSLPAGAHTTVFLPAVVASSAVSGTLIDFSPTVSDDSAASDSDMASVTVDSDTHFDLSINESADPSTPGSLLTYQITWSYRANGTVAVESDLEFPLPAGTTFVSASDGGISNGTSVSWSLGFIEPGDGGIREVTVMLDEALTSPSVVRASAQLINVEATNEMARAATVITSSAPLSLVIESNHDPAMQNEIINFTAVVTNNDPFTRFGLILTARQPQNMNQIFESEFDGDCPSTSCTAGELITWTLGDLPAGASVSVDLPEHITTTAAVGALIDLFMVVTDDQGLQSTQSDTIRIQEDPLFDIALAESTDPVTPGSQLAYRVHFGYRAEAPAVSESILIFHLPAGTSFVSATDSGSPNDGEVTWALGILNPGDGGFRDVTIVQDGELPASSTLEAWAQIESLSSVHERARAEAATSIASSSALTLSIESNTQPVRGSELAQIVLTVTNRDPFTHFGVELTSRIPQSTNQLFESEFDGDCTSNSCTAGERVTWALGTIPAGQSRSVDLPLVATPGAVDGDLLNLFARARDDQGLEARATDALRIQSDSLYDLSLAESSDPASGSGMLRYELNFSYRDNAASVGESRLRLVLPDGVTFVSASGAGVLVNDEVQWPLGFLHPGVGGQQTVEVTIDDGLNAGAVLKAEAIVELIASTHEHARARAFTVISANKSLSLGIEANPGSGRAGELSHLQAVIGNHDPFTRFGVTLTGRLPQSLNQVFEVEFDGDCTSTSCTSGERITWSLGSIPSGETVSVQLPVVLANAISAGELVNFYLQAKDDQNFETRQMDTIRADTDRYFEVAVSEDADPAIAGEPITYRVTFGYRADAGVVNQSGLTLTLPPGVTPVSTTGGGAISGNEVTWSLGFLNPGDGGERMVTATIDADVTAASILEAQARVYALGDAGNLASAEAVTAIEVDPPLSLSISSTPPTAHATEELLLQYSVKNNSSSTRFGVMLEGRFPQNLNQVSEADFEGNCTSTSCTAGELIRWGPFDLTSGGMMTVDMPTTVASGVLDGQLIEFYAVARDDQGGSANAVQVVRMGEPEVIENVVFEDGFEQN